MSESLALKYRPRSWSDLVGQRSVQVPLQKMVIKDEIHDVLLFEGSRGTGKTTTARVLAAALNCEMPPGPCTQCASCKAVYENKSLAMYEIDAASTGGADDIRALREQLLYSVGSKKRIVALDECHSMSKHGFNALLKTLEEPPPDTVFILLTTEPSKIPDTVISRCTSYNFKRIPIKDIVERLQYICKQEDINAEDALLATIAERSNGGMRDAVMTLDQLARSSILTLDAFIEHIGELDFAPPLVSKMLAADLPGVVAAVEEQVARTGDYNEMITQLMSVFIDVMVLKSGGELSGRQGAYLESRRALAAQIDLDKAFASLQVLWKLKIMRLGDDARTMLELAAFMITEVLTKGSRVSSSSSQPQPSQRLSLSEMRNMSM